MLTAGSIGWPAVTPAAVVAWNAMLMSAALTGNVPARSAVKPVAVSCTVQLPPFGSMMTTLPAS